MTVEARRRLVEVLQELLESHRRGRVTVAVVAVLVAVLFATASVVRLLPDSATHPLVVGSGVTPTGSAQALVERTGRSTAWSSAGSRTVRPRLVLTWPERTQLGSLELRSSVPRGLDAAYLRFGDGSRLRVQANRAGDIRVSFAPRVTTRLTIVLLGTRQSTRVGLASLKTSADGGPAPGVGARPVAVRSYDGTRLPSLAWGRLAEISSVWLTTRAPEPRPLSGRLRFSDGSTVKVASVGRAGGLPNIVAFTPRMVDGVRYLGQGQNAVATLAVYRSGAQRAAPHGAETYAITSQTADATCDATPGTDASLRVLCPPSSTIVGPRFVLRVAGPVGQTVTASAWRRGVGRPDRVGRIASGKIPARGWLDLPITTRLMYSGPTAIRVSTATARTYLQVVNRFGTSPAVRSPSFTRRMSLQVDEPFSRPVSISAAGDAAQYAALKPSASGPSAFGSAAFGDPASDPPPFGTERGALRIQAITTKDATGAVAYRSGLLSSVGLSGGGFSAQYGYFEATMLGAPGAGAWAAFWTQGIGSVLGSGAPFGEADATELYGGRYARTCSGVLDWTPRPELPRGLCAEPKTMDDWALEYHTYGIEIRPDATNAYVDGRLVGHFRSAVLAEDPSFFMIDLALGGGYAVDLRGQQGVTRLYATEVKVWT